MERLMILNFYPKLHKSWWQRFKLKYKTNMAISYCMVNKSNKIMYLGCISVQLIWCLYRCFFLHKSESTEVNTVNQC